MSLTLKKIRTSELKYLLRIAFALTALLLIVWPMPGTIALRHGALFVLFVMTLTSLVFNWRLQAAIKLPRVPIAIISALTFWICLVILIWGQEPTLSWSEFVPQWVVPMLVALVGWGLVRWSWICNRQQVLIKTVFFALLASVVIQDLMGIMYLLETHEQPFRQASILYVPRLAEGVPWREAFDGNFGEKFSFVNNMFVAFVLAEIGQRVLTRKRWLQVSNSLLGFGLLSALLCSYWLSFRNGNIGLVALLGLFGVLLVFANRTRTSIGKRCLMVFLLGAILISLTYFFVKSDNRWQNFRESVLIAINDDKSFSWLNTSQVANYSILADGRSVEGSAYLRVSWIKEGLKMSLRYPWGTGFNRNAFFDTLDREYNMNGRIRGGHSHSGIVDFMIANGIPGVILWLAFLTSCAWVGWGMVRQGNVAQGLTVVFLVTGFFNRGLIDSNIRDHVLQQFLFLLTIYMTIQMAPVSSINQNEVNHELAA